jgi:hypothetical protein
MKVMSLPLSAPLRLSNRQQLALVKFHSVNPDLHSLFGAVIAVPDSNSAFRGTASFDYSIEANDVCFARGAELGMFVTIINLDNSRSTTCIAALVLDENAADIVMHPNRFAAIGDPTDAPITVEYRW